MKEVKSQSILVNIAVKVSMTCELCVVFLAINLRLENTLLHDNTPTAEMTSYFIFKELNFMKNKGLGNIILIVVFALVFLVTSVLFKVFGVTDIWSQLTGTLLGTIITAIVTLALLRVQTDKEIGHDRDVGIFEKKQEVYHNFIEALESITQDGKVNVPSVEGHDKTAQDELQHLIYQLGFVQMLAASDTAEKITKLVGDLLSSLSLMNSTDLHKNEAYAHLAKNVFDIVSLLRKDLFSTKSKPKEEFNPVSKEKFNAAIRASGAFDKELLSDSGREGELKNFLLLLQKIFEEKGRKPFIIYRSDQPRKTEEITNIAHGYVNTKAGRAIQFKFPLKEKRNLLFQFTFDDAGDFYSEFKDGQNATSTSETEKYRKLLPADPYINFLDTNIEGYKRFARLTEDGKKAFVQNIVDGVEKKLSEIFNSAESEN